jgi:hypothetical protein
VIGNKHIDVPESRVVKQLFVKSASDKIFKVKDNNI